MAKGKIMASTLLVGVALFAYFYGGVKTYFVATAFFGAVLFFAWRVAHSTPPGSSPHARMQAVIRATTIRLIGTGAGVSLLMIYGYQPLWTLVGLLTALALHGLMLLNKPN